MGIDTTMWSRRRPSRKPSNPRQHVYDGFPHFSTAKQMCICLQPCCQDDQGCRCKLCPCKLGVPHTKED